MTAYGPPTANEHLRSSMHNSINFPNHAPLCCCEGAETVVVIDGPTMRSKIVSWCVFPVVILALVVGCIAAVNATERTPDRPFEIIALRTGAYYREDRPNIVRISLPNQKPYASKTDCDIAIFSVRVDRMMGGEAGWKLSCRESDK